MVVQSPFIAICWGGGFLRPFLLQKDLRIINFQNSSVSCTAYCDRTVQIVAERERERRCVCLHLYVCVCVFAPACVCVCMCVCAQYLWYKR